MDWFGRRARQRAEVSGKILGAFWMMRDGRPARKGDPSGAEFAGARRGSAGAALAITAFLKTSRKPEPLFALMASLLMIYNLRATLYYEGGEFDEPRTEEEHTYIESALQLIAVQPDLAVEAAQLIDVKFDKFLVEQAQVQIGTDRRRAAGLLIMALWQAGVHLWVSLPALKQEREP